MKLVTNVPAIETGAYFLIWIGVVLFSGFKVKKIGDDLVRYRNEDFSDGWKILGNRKKDISDFDWEIIVYIIFHQFLWLCIHLVTSESLRRRNYHNLLPFVQIAVTLSYLIYNFDVMVLPIVLFQPVIFEILSRLKRKSLIWQFEAICFVLLYGYKRCYNKKCIPFYNPSYNDHTIVMLSLYWTNLRCISYSLSKLDKTIRKTGFIVILSYCLYLPLLTLGPFVDIHDFVKSHVTSKLTFFKRLTTCCINLGRFVFWWLVIEFFLHYIYSSYLSFYPKFVERFDSWTLCGYGYCMGQYFHMKYVVSYGISTTLAKFENISAPDTPKCIGRIHLYSDMWRYFDNGLYVYLKSYIYVPLKKMKFPPYLASFCSFCFVYVWHGLTKDIMIWAFANYICVTIESGFTNIYNRYLKKFCERSFTPDWRQRLACMLASPLLAVSAISNFYFFAGTDIGNVFFKNIFGGDLKPLCILLFCLYCCCQASIYIKRREQLEFISTKLK